ncbi:hypothetical protein Scep_011646 [Stephania cephalantha]|uniref:Uncharacterized protein n=1 Tax=Stephania cephalantha TaxID=152367 RepID=A0AAP0JDS1_9MAGN
MLTILVLRMPQHCLRKDIVNPSLPGDLSSAQSFNAAQTSCFANSISSPPTSSVVNAPHSISMLSKLERCIIS